MAERLITPVFWVGEEVYLKTDTEDSPGIVTAVVVLDGLCYKYVVAFGFHVREYSELELESMVTWVAGDDDDDEDEDEE